MIPKSDSKFTSLIILLLSLIVFVFFTRDLYSQMQEVQANKEQNIQEHNQKEEKLLALNITSEKLKKIQGKIATQYQIDKYLEPFNEESILNNLISEYMKKEWKNSNIQQRRDLNITHISFTEWIKNDLGFMESQILLRVSVKNKKTLLQFIDFFINNKKYKFFITDITIPSFNRRSTIVSIPLKLYYVDVSKNKTTQAPQAKK